MFELFRKFNKDDCCFRSGNKCIYSKNKSCNFCVDYMKNIDKLNLYEKIMVNENRKNRSLKLSLTIISFVFSCISIYISLTKL